MRYFGIFAILLGLNGDAAMAVTGTVMKENMSPAAWAYDNVRERAESQIRIRRLQYMLDHNKSTETERQLIEAINRENARR